MFDPQQRSRKKQRQYMQQARSDWLTPLAGFGVSRGDEPVHSPQQPHTREK
jgi:hypothetical protein